MADEWDEFPLAEAPARDPWDEFQRAPQSTANQWDEFRPAEFAQSAPQAPAAPEAEGMLATGLRKAAHTVLPAAAGLAAVPAGIAGGALLGLPAGGWGAIPGAVIGGVGAFMGASALQETALKAMGFDDSHQQAVNAKTNPMSSLAGEIAGTLPFAGVGAATTAVRAGSAVAGGLLEAGGQMLGGEELDPKRIAGATAAGGVLARPTRLGEAIGSRSAAAIGRPDLWPKPHGTAGPLSSAGTAQEAIPPSNTAVADPQNKATIGETGVREAGGERLTSTDESKVPPIPPPTDETSVKVLDAGRPVDSTVEVGAGCRGYRNQTRDPGNPARARARGCSTI